MSSVDSAIDEDNYSIVQKKSLVITLGNAKDLPSLLNMLETEKHPDVLSQVIIVLGAMGRKEAIPALEKLCEQSQSSKVQQQAVEAIEVIISMSSY